MEPKILAKVAALIEPRALAKIEACGERVASLKMELQRLKDELSEVEGRHDLRARLENQPNPEALNRFNQHIDTLRQRVKETTKEIEALVARQQAELSRAAQRAVPALEEKLEDLFTKCFAPCLGALEALVRGLKADAQGAVMLGVGRGDAAGRGWRVSGAGLTGQFPLPNPWVRLCNADQLLEVADMVSAGEDLLPLLVEEA